MQVFVAQNLAFLAVPKTGTTAWEAALAPHADITFRRGLKHMTAQKFQRRMVPFLKTTYGLDPERVAVMRDPLDQMRSWYRYRLDAADRRAGNDTSGMSFEAFALDAIRPKPPSHAAIGSQFNFLTGYRGRLLVTHLFAYERQQEMRDFLEFRFGQALKLTLRNASAPADTDLTPATLDRVRAARARDVALYERLMEAGGYLETPIG